jgi:hypothetical protein
VQRAIESLRELPPVPGEVVARIVAAAARSRGQDALPNEDDLLPAEGARHRTWRVAAVAAAALLIASVITFATVRAPRPASPLAQPIPATSASASLGAVESAPLPTQFIFDGKARHVSLVGDFNNWDERAAPLTREPGTSLWSVTVPIVRGRHIYAFLVDSVWTVDKRAPVARDPDFGVTGSVILVGRP